jgi:HlyD family secretion protein
MKKSVMMFMLVAGIVVGIVAIPVVGALIGNVTKLITPEVTATELVMDERHGMSVDVSRVIAGPIETSIGYSGSISPVSEVDVFPKASGRIDELKVSVGDVVQKGDTLAVLESETLQKQVEQTKAALKVAEIQIEQMRAGGRPAQIAAAQAGVDAAQAQLDRAAAPLNQNEISVAKAAEAQAAAALKQAQAAYDQIAWFDGKGMLPQSLGLQQATIAHEAAQAQYEEALAGAKPETIRAAQAMVDQAKAQLELAKNPYRDTDLALAGAQYLQAKAALDLMEMQLEETTIKAPITGVVSDVPLSVGATAGTSKAIATMVSSNVEIIVKVEESRIGEIRKGQPTSISVSAYPGETFTGQVYLISPTANSSDRTFEVRISPDKQGDMLRAGMFADVNLVTEQFANALLVPTSSVVTEGDRSYVFVVSNDQVEKRPVTVGLSKKDVIQIKSGLALGEQIVLSGQNSLKSGDLVTVKTG